MNMVLLGVFFALTITNAANGDWWIAAVDFAFVILYAMLEYLDRKFKKR